MDGQGLTVDTCNNQYELENLISILHLHFFIFAPSILNVTRNTYYNIAYH